MHKTWTSQLAIRTIIFHLSILAMIVVLCASTLS